MIIKLENVLLEVDKSSYLKLGVRELNGGIKTGLDEIIANALEDGNSLVNITVKVEYQPVSKITIESDENVVTNVEFDKVGF